MLKKIMSILFEEEEIIEEEIVKPTPVKKQAPVVEKPIQEIPQAKPYMDTVKSELHIEEQRPSLKRIDADQEIKPIKKPVIEKKEVKPYEFSEVISPIFGKSVKEEPIIKAVQPTMAIESEKSVLGTIISPIYGINKVEKNKKPEVVVAKTVEHLSLEDLMGLQPEDEFEQEQFELSDEDVSESTLFDSQIFDSKETL